MQCTTLFTLLKGPPPLLQGFTRTGKLNWVLHYDSSCCKTVGSIPGVNRSQAPFLTLKVLQVSEKQKSFIAVEDCYLRDHEFMVPRIV